MLIKTMYKRLVFSLLFLQIVACGNQAEINILNFGAKGDGQTDNTEVIQKAIDQISRNGGGKVIVPNGQFLTGVIQLKSNMELHLEEGAVLLGSDKRMDYGPSHKASPLIVANGQHNIAITGDGVIDGNGHKLIKDIYKMLNEGTLEDLEYQTYNPWHQKRPEEGNRPKILYIYNCDSVQVKDVTFKNGLCWIQDYRNSSNIVVDRVKVKSTTFLNNDGIDLTDCVNARVTNCIVDTADDGICLKSSTNNLMCENIYVANCKVRSSASAIKFGTASRGGFKNVTIKDIEVYDTFRSAIAIESVDGGTVENINVSNINASNTGNAIFIRLGHRSGDKPGSVRNINIKNVKVQVPFGRPDKNYEMNGPEVRVPHNTFPSSIVGIPGHIVENVVLENIEIAYPGRASREVAYIPTDSLSKVPENIKDYPEFSMFGELPAWGFYVRHARGIEFNNVKVTIENDDYRPAFVFDQAHDITLKNVTIPESKDDQIIVKDATVINIDVN
ncbi:glycoside hydrolase family 28 protein [Aestuariivivens sediminis]|uniref:glycoside hydrolase family 28 protein n=1 Tax=Aestuariivivens sediminis TaxID=2913557 RepID=UPI001F5991CE|nr:glycoside hydrolase family 28 protein [Aestuariivivens sediminis]